MIGLQLRVQELVLPQPVRSMGRAIDLLEAALEAILADGRLILDECFMWDIFNYKELIDTRASCTSLECQRKTVEDPPICCAF